MRYGLIACAAAALSATACGGGHPAPPMETTATAVAVETAVRRDRPQTIDVGGTVRARDVAPLASRIVAAVQEIRVRPGDRVRAGQPLVLLDTRELAANNDRADAGLAASRQALAAAAADEAGAAAAVTLARASHARVAQLYEKRAATRQELDEAVAALAGSDARASAAGARRLEAERGLAAAAAAARAATVTRSYGVIAAPFDGVVTDKLVDAGSLATPGVPLIVVENDRSFRLEAGVDEARAAAIHRGDAVRVTVEALGCTLDGSVSEVIRAIDPIAHTALVKIDLPANAGLRSGMFGRAALPAGTVRALSVPASALVRRGQLTFVFVVDRHAARMRLVRAGRTADGRVSIEAGLGEGEVVIVDPPEGFSDGRAVAVRPAAAGARP